jgi:hypothetical protein
MKHVILVLWSVLTLASHSAIAQTMASSYEGLTAAINMNFTTIGVEASDPLGNSLGKVNASDQNVIVQVAFGTSLGDKGVANFGVSANLGEMKSGSIGPLQLKATGSYAIYTELGYAVDIRSLVYAKLSANQLTATLSGGGTGLDGTLITNGIGIGAGYRHNLSQGLYVQGELMQVNYNAVPTGMGLVFRPASNLVMVGFGLKF